MHNKPLRIAIGAAPMQLYVTYGSPYARLARIVVVEKGLEDRVEIIEVKTRMKDSPYYQISLSGRVPYLVDDTGVGMEDSQLICAYLDSLDGKPRLHDPLLENDWPTADSRRARAACAKASVYGCAKCICPNASVRRPSLLTRSRAASAWRAFSRSACPTRRCRGLPAWRTSSWRSLSISRARGASAILRLADHNSPPG